MSKLIIAGALIIVVIGGIVLFAGMQNNQAGTPNPTPTDSTSSPQATTVQEASPSPSEAAMEEEGAVMEKTSVEIKNFAFGPKTLTIKKGTSVTFTNQDSVAHTATADDGSFDTGLLAKGESGSITLDKAGTFNYHCTPHPNMKATIVVE